MSTILKFSICETADCKNLKFKELTDSYSATNPGGWGTPNEETTDASSAIITISLSGVVIGTVDAFASGFPTVDETKELEILSSTFDLESFKDGLYEFTYTVNTGTATYVTTRQMYLYCHVQCCVNKLLSQLSPEDCICQPDLVKKTLLAKSYLDALGWAVSCGLSSEALKFQELLDKLCDCDC